MVVCKLFIEDRRYHRRVLIYSVNVKEPVSHPHSSHHPEILNNSDLQQKKSHKKKKWLNVIKILYAVLSIVNILLSIVLMAVSVSTAITLKIFSSEQSGRLVALIILTVTAAITLSITIYAMVAALRKQTKPVHAASIAFMMLAIVQAIIVGTTMRVTQGDEIKLTDSLAKSFELARQDNPMYMKLWSLIQYDLSCCGVISPKDYLNSNMDIFTPNIPISCCPSYDPNRSELMQERERATCRARKEYYSDGCLNPVLDLFRFMANRVVSVAVVLISFKVLLSILGLIWIRFYKGLHETEENLRSSDMAIDNISKP